MTRSAPDPWRIARLWACVTVMALLLSGGAAVRLAGWWCGTAPASAPPPFRDPTHPDPFCRLWRYMDEGAYSFHLFKTKGIILTTDEWRD